MLITQFKLVTEEEETASRSNNSIKTIITHHASETTVVQAPNDMFHPKRSRKIGELCKCRIDQLRFDNLCHHNKRRLVKDNKAAISSNCPNLSHSQFPQSKFISALFMRIILGQQQQHDEGIHAREKKVLSVNVETLIFHKQFTSFFGKRNWRERKKYDFQLFMALFVSDRRWDMQDISIASAHVLVGH